MSDYIPKTSISPDDKIYHFGKLGEIGLTGSIGYTDPIYYKTIFKATQPSDTAVNTATQPSDTAVNTATQPSSSHDNDKESLCRTIIVGVLQKTIVESDNFDECDICMSNTIDPTSKKVFGPCGHGDICTECINRIILNTKSDEYMSCPKCRTDVNMVITQYST